MFALFPKGEARTIARDLSRVVNGDDVFAHMLGDDGGRHINGTLPRNHSQCGTRGHFLPTGYHIGFTVNFCERGRNWREHFNHGILSVE